MSAELSVAVVSMIIACVAFFVSGSQLSQQLFGTADGFRRCQASIIGKYYDLVKLRWRWSSFRFETIVTTPHFIMDYPSSDDSIASNLHTRSSSGPGYDGGHTSAIAITGTAVSREETRSSPASEHGEATEELVSWLQLLDNIHTLQSLQVVHGTEPNPRGLSNASDSLIRESGHKGRPSHGVAMQLKSRSWDLMPPDLIRPLATTDVRTMIIMGHRLGMSWREIHPSQNRMYAEGQGQSFLTSDVMGLGIVVRYNTQRTISSAQRRKDILKHMRIPSVEADKMGCGIIPGNKALNTFDLYVTDSSDTNVLESALKHIGLFDDFIEAICNTLTSSEGSDRLPGFSDVPSLWCDWLLAADSPVITVLSPIRARARAVLESIDTVNVFRELLRKEESESRGGLSKQKKWVLRQFELWQQDHPAKLDQFHHVWLTRKAWNDPARLEYTHYLKGIYDRTTAWFVEKQEIEKTPVGSWREDDGFYRELIKCHVSMASSSAVQARKRISEGTCQAEQLLTYQPFDKVIAERAMIYYDELRIVTGYMDYGGFGREGIEDAWWTLMLRGLAWGHSVVQLPSESAPAAPSYLYDSTTPVYIT